MKRLLLSSIIVVLIIPVACNKDKGQKDNMPKISEVDLGLDVKWANMNLGAKSPASPGDYFAWGETEPKTDYSWATYKWCNGTSSSITKYCLTSQSGTVDNKEVLELEDDAAHVVLGGRWRMPTDAEWRELKEKCDWQRDTLDGVFGYTIKSKVNENSIFLPAVGGMEGKDLYSAGSSGYYWSSSLYKENSGLGLLMYFYSVTSNTYGRRSFGLPIRAVTQ